jgi:hypothetical protein
VKTLVELQEYFYSKIYPNLEELEVQRKKDFSSLVLIGVFLIVMALLVFVLFKDTFFFHNGYESIFIIPIAIFIFFYSLKQKSFQNRFKDEVIKKIVGFISKNLLYKSESHITKAEYEQSRLFLSKVDKFGGNDLIEGYINGVFLKFSDLHTLEKKESSKGKSFYETIFQGLFFVADFNKNFYSQTVVLPDRSERFLGTFAHIFQSLSSYGQLVKLDNPEFEKEFVTYSLNQIEARYILSHSLMKNILELKKLFRSEIALSFNGSKIFIAIFKDYDNFEGKIYKKVTDFNEVKLYFQTISLMVDILEVLKLQRKIWSKE